MDLTVETGSGRNGPEHGSARPGAVGSGTVGSGTVGRIEVEIGELVLDGFARIDHDRLTAAFRSELTRLVEARGVPLAAGGDRALDLLSGLPPLPAGASPQRLGEALARAVHAGLSGDGRPPSAPPGRRRT
ncbi:hypothetical protein ABZW03_38375 [Kitasatospora sp. NPDC004799]|uniref:hypothetical protein n=1 Tax=Kitasatospora sp. NPDC004799 TaxID=3154460 RepID=UPI0033BB3461